MSRWFPDRLLLRLVPRAGETAFELFERQLEAMSPARGTHLTCVLGGDTVRWRIVPWKDTLAGAAQRQALAENCFAEAYGDAAKAWAVRRQPGRHGAATLACAVDATLPDRLDALARSRALRLVSVQPSLMHAHNGVRARLVDDLFWFVWDEGSWRTLLLMSHGEPLQVKLMQRSGASLARSLDREWFALGIESARCPVYVARADGAREAGEAAGDWAVVELPSPGPTEGAAVARPLDEGVATA